MTEERLDAYGRHVRGIAEIDIGLMPTASAEDAIRYAVLGTAVYEPVIAAMRRLAHQDVAQKRLRNPKNRTSSELNSLPRSQCPHRCR